MLPLVLIPQHFGALLYDRRDGRYYPYDDEAAAVLSALCAADVDAVALRSPDPERVEAFCDGLLASGFLTADGRLAATRLDASPPPDHLLGPLAVHLEVVARCNLSCTHCFAAPMPRARDALSLAELDDLFGQMAAMGSQRLGLTGGEPLSRRDLLDVIDAAIGHGLSPSLTTNALLLTDALAAALGRRRLLWLNVSLDGATAEVNDAIRGPGTFRRVLGKLALLREHARFSLAFTLTADNLHQAADCARLARDVGADSAVFRPLYPAGAARHRPELMPDFSGYLAALREVEGLVVDAQDAFGPAQRAAAQGRVTPAGGCGAGNLICSISADGRVNPCSYLGPELDAASLRTHRLAEIWHDSQTFRAIRALPSGPGCFSGGCRARAQALRGDLNAPDPWQEAATTRHATLTTEVSP